MFSSFQQCIKLPISFQCQSENNLESCHCRGQCTMLIHFTRYRSVQPQRKRLLLSSTIILQGNIRDGAQNNPKGLIQTMRHSPKAVVWKIGDLKHNFVGALALVCPSPRPHSKYFLKRPFLKILATLPWGPGFKRHQGLRDRH